ncbi:delta-like protein D, partial [Dinothrombium tinctorium]
TTSSSHVTYYSEFEIIDYTNTEGRLLSGDCCSGYKSTLGHGLCRGGNSSCNPYWKICLTFQDHANAIDKNETLMLLTQRRSELFGNAGPRFSFTSKRRSSSKPSVFKNFLNRIMSSIKAIQSVNEVAVDSNNRNQESSPSPCSLGFWSTDAINKDGAKYNSVKLRARIPSDYVDKRIAVEANETKNKSDAILPRQKVLVFVEIWHKSNGGENNDKLIARHIEQSDANIQLPLQATKNYWRYGGTNSKKINATAGIYFHYRWRLLAKEEGNEVEQPVCPPGFTGSSCNQPICKRGCHQAHGYCEKPSECKCKFGWTGDNCSLCLQMPGCIHGSCIKPFECRCEDGWSGMFCDKPTCKVGCHPQNGYCEHPGECR